MKFHKTHMCARLAPIGLHPVLEGWVKEMYLKYSFLHKELKEKSKELKLKVIFKCWDDQNKIVLKQFSWAHEKSVWQSCYLLLVVVGKQGLFSLELPVQIKLREPIKYWKGRQLFLAFPVRRLDTRYGAVRSSCFSHESSKLMTGIPCHLRWFPPF